MKLETGMYIRTDEGIRKILNEYEEGYELDRSLHYLYPEGHDLYKEDLEDEEEIVTKASFDIIDLIEEGDYVNGAKVNRIKKDYIVINEIWTGREYLSNEDIKSIVTKEQFKQMEYKVVSKC